MVEQANSIFGRIDILFNNAGVTQRSLAKDTDIKVYRQLIDTDLMAPIALTQLVAPQMIERGEGKIVAIASITGKFGVPLRTAYCAAKHGMFGYFDALRTEVGYRGVDIHVVAPGSVRTDLARNAMTSSGDRFGKTDSSIESGYEASYVADKVLRRIARGEKEIILVRGRERMMLIFRKFFPEIFFRKLNDAAPKFVQEFVASQDG
jgi:short-subunit dehydrogenase